jgi:hypothetical protein
MRSLQTLAAVALVALIACSSSSSGNNGGSDSGTWNTFTCGGGSVTGTLRLTDASSLGPIAGATLAAQGCSTAQTDDRGYVNFASDPTLLVKLTVTDPTGNHLTEYAEVTVTQNAPNISTYMFPTADKNTLFTGWNDASQGYVGIIVQSDGSDAGPCATNDGVTVTVKNHPEISIGYAVDQNTRSPTATATTTFGAAVAGPIPPGTYEIDLAKTGCKNATTSRGVLAYSNTITVTAGTLTAVLVALTPG